MSPIAETPNPTSITFEPGRVVVIRHRRARKFRRYEGEAQRWRLLLFCVEAGWRRSETRVGVIWRNWL